MGFTILWKDPGHGESSGLPSRRGMIELFKEWRQFVTSLLAEARNPIRWVEETVDPAQLTIGLSTKPIGLSVPSYRPQPPILREGLLPQVPGLVDEPIATEPLLRPPGWIVGLLDTLDRLARPGEIIELPTLHRIADLPLH